MFVYDRLVVLQCVSIKSDGERAVESKVSLDELLVLTNHVEASHDGVGGVALLEVELAPEVAEVCAGGVAHQGAGDVEGLQKHTHTHTYIQQMHTHMPHTQCGRMHKEETRGAKCGVRLCVCVCVCVCM